MGTKLPPQELALYLSLDELLFREWDPIGISNPQHPVDDEYRAYLPQLFRLVMDSVDQQSIAEYLNRIQTDGIGLDSNLPHCLRIAERAFELKAQAGLPG